MSSPTVDVAALVLAAGSSRRLGRPKQLLPYQGATLLDATLAMARSAPFAQRLVTIGGAADDVRATVDLDGFVPVLSEQHTAGCSSSLVAALPHIDDDAAGFVLLLGDQPGVNPAAIERLVAAASDAKAPIAICEYDDGIGHPFWFARVVFADLMDLHGDKAVWKVIESGRHDVLRVPTPGPIPPDVDTWDDYQALLASAASTMDA